MLSLLHVGNPLFPSRSTLHCLSSARMAGGCGGADRPHASLSRPQGSGLRLPFTAWRRTSACAPRAAFLPPAADVPPLHVPDSNGSLEGLWQRRLCRRGLPGAGLAPFLVRASWDGRRDGHTTRETTKESKGGGDEGRARVREGERERERERATLQAKRDFCKRRLNLWKHEKKA